MTIRETVAAGDVIGPSLPAAAIDVSGLQAVSVPSLAVDALLIIVTSVAAGSIYGRLALGTPIDLSVLAGTGALAASLFCAIMRIWGTASPLRISTSAGRARAAAATWTATFLFLVLIAFTMKVSESFSRGAVLSFFFCGLPLVVASRIVVPRTVARVGLANTYRGLEAIVLAAQNDAAVRTFLSELRRRGCVSINLIEFDPSGDATAWSEERQRLIARALDRARIGGAGDIYVVAPALSHERAASILSGLRLVPRAVFLVPDPIVSKQLRSSVRDFGPAVAIEMQRAPLSKLQRAAKRAIDVGVATAATIFFTPLFLVIALAIAIDSPGPIFFRQLRNGCRGEPFRIWKFRTMSVLEDGATVVQASRDDARVTRVGKFLRRTSLDECPQIFNVLSGEMSLVGPRPHAAAHDALYARLIENYALRQHVKPGITGWAQVNGHRGETPTVESMYRRIENDLWYAANCSISLDLGILFRTVGVIFGQRNAY